jgi:hypothetical protein
MPGSSPGMTSLVAATARLASDSAGPGQKIAKTTPCKGAFTAPRPAFRDAANPLPVEQTGARNINPAPERRCGEAVSRSSRCASRIMGGGGARRNSSPPTSRTCGHGPERPRAESHRGIRKTAAAVRRSARSGRYWRFGFLPSARALFELPRAYTIKRILHVKACRRISAGMHHPVRWEGEVRRRRNGSWPGISGGCARKNPGRSTTSPAKQACGRLSSVRWK